MKIGVLIAALAGLGLAVWLVVSYGLDRILDLLCQAGWSGMAAVIAVHLVQLMMSAEAWRQVAGPRPRRLTFGGYCRLRWVRESVNNLLPVAQIGGPFAAVRLQQRQSVPLPAAIAGTVADLTMEVVTQIMFTILGLSLLLHGSGAHGLPDYVTGLVAVAVLVTAGFIGAQWFGLARVLEKALIRIGGRLGWAGMKQVDGLHQALLRCYRRPRGMLLAVWWHGISWLLGGVEVCLALHFLGHDTSLRNGMVVESLGQALKAAGFAVPGALGVQEGGFVVICQTFNLPPEIAIALSLMKRLREFVFGLPGLVAWRI